MKNRLFAIILILDIAGIIILRSVELGKPRLLEPV
jgi:hypothetical protein